MTHLTSCIVEIRAIDAACAARLPVWCAAGAASARRPAAERQPHPAKRAGVPPRAARALPRSQQDRPGRWRAPARSSVHRVALRACDSVLDTRVLVRAPRRHVLPPKVDLAVLRCFSRPTCPALIMFTSRLAGSRLAGSESLWKVLVTVGVARGRASGQRLWVDVTSTRVAVSARSSTAPDRFSHVHYACSKPPTPAGRPRARRAPPGAAARGASCAPPLNLALPFS